MGAYGRNEDAAASSGPAGSNRWRLELPVGLLRVAHGVAQLGGVWPLTPALGGELGQPELVLEVVAVEQRVLDDGQVAGTARSARALRRK